MWEWIYRVMSSVENWFKPDLAVAEAASAPRDLASAASERMSARHEPPACYDFEADRPNPHRKFRIYCVSFRSRSAPPPGLPCAGELRVVNDSNAMNASMAAIDTLRNRGYEQVAIHRVRMSGGVDVVHVGDEKPKQSA